MEKNEQEIVLVELNSYVKPEIKEVSGKEWVLNGRDNSFFQYVIDRFNGSPTNAAIVNGFTEMIYGKGLTATNPEQRQALDIFPANEIRKIVSDFKLFGSATLQVVYSKGRGALRKVTGVYHIPRETIAPAKMNEEGEIEGYYYAKDWKKTRGKANEPEYFPAFGMSKDAPIEIMAIEPYKAGKHYFADPDYLSGLQYATLEEEISNYAVSHIQNGLSAGYIINFNNGVPPKEKREEIKRDIRRQLQGSGSAGNVIIAFNDNPENGATIVPIPSNATHKQWDFWVGEARTQIMVAHRVISPMLFGIKDNSGLGNNAQELETATRLLYGTVITPMQELLLESLKEVLMVNGFDTDLEFKPLMTFVKEDGTEQQEGEAVELKKKDSDDGGEAIARALLEKGEEIDEDEWELVFEEAIEGEPDHNQELNLASDFPSTWAAASEQDTELFRVRYSYAPSTFSVKSRAFCRIMASKNKVYRKEDIDAAGSMGVNAGFGLGGATDYSIWLYKGGVNCKHFWQRKVYLKKNNERISANEARRILNGLDPSDRADARMPENDPLVARRPFDMPNNGRA